MYQPYQVVNRCLHAVQSLEIPLTRKLQIEIELLQVKRLLLLMDGESCGSTLVNQEDFAAFEAAFLAACSTGEKEKLMPLVEELRSVLAVIP